MSSLTSTAQLVVTDRSGVKRTIDGEHGLSVMEIIRNDGAEEPFALCGGGCSCATCHVYVDPAYAEALPEMSADENDVLDGASHRRDTSRLSCQMTFRNELSGLVVEIAPAD
jgi:ferredoxin, 2Fe-2S